jgi:hypothetical protein
MNKHWKTYLFAVALIFGSKLARNGVLSCLLFINPPSISTPRAVRNVTSHTSGIPSSKLTI